MNTWTHNKIYNSPEQTVCIVGMGCVLPGASDIDAFWQQTIAAKPALQSVPNDRWKMTSHYHQDRDIADKTYACLGGFVNESDICQWSEKLNINRKTHHRLMIMTLAACQQALTSFDNDDLTQFKVDSLLGCMATDESAHMRILHRETRETIDLLKNQKPKGWLQAIEKIESYFEQHLEKDIPVEQTFLTTAIIKTLQQRFGFYGEGALLDAACASSLAAIDSAVTRLRNQQCDLAICGGIEGDLGPSTFVLFSAVGALAQQVCAPFDQQSQGLIQGEGTVIFALQRLSDAIAQNRPIHGIITATGAASDGRSSSLFSPTVNGQLLAYQQAYQQAGMVVPDYIECHGTGTYVGDTTELSSLTEFFKEQPLTIGSIKALIGHTKGTAGAAGLLKSVLMMQHRLIPASPYFTKLAKAVDDIHLNSDVIPFTQTHPLRIGISAFGFGNINYHLILDEYNSQVAQQIDAVPKSNTAFPQAVVLSHVDVSKRDVQTELKAMSLNIAPHSFPQTDERQLQAVVAALQAFYEAGISLQQIDHQQVSVFAASCLCLPTAQQFANRINYDDLLASCHEVDASSLSLIKQRKQRFMPVTEDIGPGILNNVIAAKVCNSLDFNGKNFNVDADFMSIPMTLELAKSELQQQRAKLVLVLCSHDQFNHEQGIVERNGFSCWLLSTEQEAQQQAYSVSHHIETIQFSGHAT